MDSLITIVASIHEGDIEGVNGRLDAMGNPAVKSIRDRLDATDPDGSGTHFMSLHAVPNGHDGSASIIMEFTADGPSDRAIERIASAIGDELIAVFEKARDWRANVALAAYLKSHVIKVGFGIFDNPGLCFAGTPGMKVDRIKKEADLAAFLSTKVDEGGCDIRPIDRLERVRAAVETDRRFVWALDPPPPPTRDEAKLNVLALAIAHPLVRAFLAAFAAIVLGVFFVTLVMTHAWNDAFEGAGWAALLTLAAALAAIGGIYLRLRQQEKSDWCDPRAADPHVLKEMRERENQSTSDPDILYAQNHMVSVTVRKPGFVRWIMIRLIFSVIGLLATKVYRPGFLGGISTIHAARWITVPGTRNLVFFSNYGGSWESYLEDFITRAHGGLTGVWSNSIGFPRAANLVQGGATDGERFKRYARASMVPTRFWYSAYPALVTDHVRCNAALRRGLAAALTNDEASQWLALFGSGPRPDSKLETSQIQSLVFGGLGFMLEGSCVLYNLPDDREKSRDFMAKLYPLVGFGDGRRLRRRAVVTVALGPRALEKLGLPADCVRGFPAAFVEGMSIEARNRILGDINRNDPEHWEWGREPHDLALLIYGNSELSEADCIDDALGPDPDESRGDPVGALDRWVEGLATRYGMAPPHRVPLKPVEKPAKEPFGFVDGISQPVIRGSYQSFRKNDPIHLVAPGEFIIGYPDNRGNFPPEPELSALLDPDNRLPVAERSREFGNTIVEAPRAIGRNGTFLVIRQLEQDVKRFRAYCRQEAEELAKRLPAPYEMSEEFIAAKLVGRWPDGGSLVRNPYYPFSREQEQRALRRKSRDTAKGFDEASAVAASGQPLGSGTSRPETDPPEGTAIATPAEMQPEVAAGRSEPSARGDNDFLYGVEDPQATRCPFGSHIRRANPRDSLMPGSMEQVSISNRHRMLRVGRLYQPEPGRDDGLLFMCLNGDIERQFEFIQQTWLVSPAFHGLVGEQDPLTSNKDGTGYVIPSHDGPVRLNPLPQFVKMLGGGYFFMPGRSLLQYLGGI
ncbi:MAG TPA: hypothetical protein VF577_06240 [Allosphingosinicella sp.]|jgi:deferrochelatase/peroxidase EfeB